MSWERWNKISQFGLPFFTAIGFLLTALKMPQYGLVSSLVSQMFWIPSSYRAWKEAGQVGIFIATCIIATIVFAGVVNYWIF